MRALVTLAALAVTSMDFLRGHNDRTWLAQRMQVDKAVEYF